ncbi:MAG TPA: hypothetical protein ENK33_13450 [Desulfobacterales bacterium]|nr:hypothetical protein [Desulfobacterales bacterium]
MSRSVTKKIYLSCLVCLLVIWTMNGVCMAADNHEIRTSQGVIANMQGWEIDIDEIIYHYSAATVFLDHNRKPIGSGSFGPGIKVGFKWYISGREFLVTEVWKK